MSKIIIKDLNGVIIHIPSTSVQYVGFNDINKVPIFEGDTLEAQSKITGRWMRGKIEWSENSNGWRFKGDRIREYDNYLIIKEGKK